MAQYPNNSSRVSPIPRVAPDRPPMPDFHACLSSFVREQSAFLWKYLEQSSLGMELAAFHSVPGDATTKDTYFHNGFSRWLTEKWSHWAMISLVSILTGITYGHSSSPRAGRLGGKRLPFLVEHLLIEILALRSCIEKPRRSIPRQVTQIIGHKGHVRKREVKIQAGNTLILLINLLCIWAKNWSLL